MNAEDAPLSLGTAPGDGLVEGRLTKSIIGCFYEVYNTMGFAFLERGHAASLTDELEMRGHHVDRGVVTHAAYKGRIVAHFKLDRVEVGGDPPLIGDMSYHLSIDVVAS